VVITEIATVGEEPDAVGWQGTCATLVECKVSRSDFQADIRKFFRRFAEMGVGHRRYYCTPTGLLLPEEIPSQWGLLEWDGQHMVVVKPAGTFQEVSSRREIDILLSVVRRIGQKAPKGSSIKCYKHQTLNRATLTIDQELESPEASFEI
jgi:hypothetical protein